MCGRGALRSGWVRDGALEREAREEVALTGTDGVGGDGGQQLVDAAFREHGGELHGRMKRRSLGRMKIALRVHSELQDNCIPRGNPLANR